MWGKKLLKKATMVSFSDNALFRSVSLNWALHGGIDRGRIVNMWGEESSGKSLMAYELIANDLNKHPNHAALIFDCEANIVSKKQINYIRDIGVPIDCNITSEGEGDEKEDMITFNENSQTLIQWTNSPEDIFDATVDEVMPMLEEKGKKLSFVLVDSLSQISSPKEANANKTTDHQMAALAGYLPKALRKIVLDSRKHGTIWLFINQARDDFNSIQKKKTYACGRALKHGADYSMQFEKINSKDAKIESKDSKDIRGNAEVKGRRVRVKVDKCRVNGAEGRQAEFDIIFGKGHANPELEVVTFGIKKGIIEQSGPWIKYGDIKGKGINGFLKEINEDIINEIREGIMEDIVKDKDDSKNKE